MKMYHTIKRVVLIWILLFAFPYVAHYAHAQTIIAQGGRETRHDDYVKAWVDFWTFTRDGQRWVLKEILPDAQGESALARENVDEGTGQQMLEWFYSKPRAN